MAEHLVFSYGTLQLPQVQRARFGRYLYGEGDALPGFRLDTVHVTDPAVIAQSGSSEHPVAVRTDDPADEIAGTVLTLDDDDLASADDYEAAAYRRVAMTLRSGRTAWVYVEAER